MLNPLLLPAAGSAGVSQCERRAAVRFGGGPATECQAVDPRGGEPLPGWVRDLSTSGVAVVIDRAFTPGTWLILELENTHEGASLRLRACVVHAIQLPNDHWLHGCAFERELAPHELHAFIE